MLLRSGRAGLQGDAVPLKIPWPISGQMKATLLFGCVVLFLALISDPGDADNLFPLGGVEDLDAAKGEEVVSVAWIADQGEEEEASE